MPGTRGLRRRHAAALVAICVLLPPVAARAADAGAESPPPATATESGKSVAAQIAELRQRFNQAQQDAYQAYAASQGKPDEERARIFHEKLPKPHPFIQKAMELARENPKDPGAGDALVFVTELASRGGSSEDARLQAEALDQIARDQLDNPGISAVFSQFMYNPSPAGEKLMRLAAEKSTNREVRGSAMFSLAQSLRTSSERAGNEQQLAEAKKLYQQVEGEYADVKTGRGTLGEDAKANLFEMENLAIGKVAPEIEGKDANGKPLKLSDYRGKVVVLDFWGDW
jgi:hypothetical protein